MTLNSAHSSPAYTLRPSRKPRIILVFLIALCGLFVYSYTSRLSEKAHLDALIEAERGRIAQAKVEHSLLLEEQSKQDQPDYLDQKARQLFDHAQPGDTLLLIVDDPAATAAQAGSQAEAAPSNPMDSRNFPVWRQWVFLFTSDTFRLSIE